MLDYIFQFVSKVYFHIGADNIRSQIAISRIGAKKIAEQEVIYYSESPKLNYVYEISKEKWQKLINKQQKNK
jgi:N-acetyltransferase